MSALLLFAAGAGSGYMFARRGAAVVTPPPPAPVCPPAVVCAPPPATGRAVARVHVMPASKKAKPAPAALSPLPDQSPMDEGQRTQALRAFSEKKAPELRDCVA